MRAFRTDKNQKEVVKAIRDAGYVVQHLHSVGAGCPDILVGAAGVNVLIEIKDGDGKLTPDQVIWHRSWPGQVNIARNPTEALEIIKNAIQQKPKKKGEKSTILVAHNHTPQSGSRNSPAIDSSHGADEVQGGTSDRGKLAHGNCKVKCRVCSCDTE